MKKAKNKIKNKKSEIYSQNEVKRYLGALSETHNEHLRGIKEGFVVVNRKIDNITETLSEHTKKLDSHTEMIGILMEDISVVKSDLKRKVDYDEFTSLVKRVSKLESKI